MTETAQPTEPKDLADDLLKKVGGPGTGSGAKLPNFKS